MKPRLIEIREWLCLSQTEMAFFLKMSQQKYCRYETGATEMKASLIWDICKQFGCTSDWLLGLVPDEGFTPHEPQYPIKRSK